MQAKRGMAKRKPALKTTYVSPNQMRLEGYQTPYEQQLTTENRWVQLAGLIPWDKLVPHYEQTFTSKEGRTPINGRVVIGALIIKHYLNITDRETIQQIRENMFMQYFLGYSSFTNEAPFSPTMFVTIRERMNLELMNKITDEVIKHGEKSTSENTKLLEDETGNDQPDQDKSDQEPVEVSMEIKQEEAKITHEGRMIIDASVAPQNITYPTDLKLIDAARKKSEELIDRLYDKDVHGNQKARTYREIAKKKFINLAKKKNKAAKEIYKANGQQIRYLKRNLSYIDRYIKEMRERNMEIPLKKKHWQYLETIKEVHRQQWEMHCTKTHRIDNRIVNIHQPYVRPIVRGKDSVKVEFGSKLQVTLLNGFSYIDKLSWDPFNEGITLLSAVEQYKNKFGFYPKEVLADKIYSNRENRRLLKELGINFKAKPLGRPSQNGALSNHVSPGDRNPIEGKFGQAKVAYGLDNIRAKLQSTSESWIATIFLVLNLLNLVRRSTLLPDLSQILQSIARSLFINRVPNYLFYTSSLRATPNYASPNFISTVNQITIMDVLL